MLFNCDNPTDYPDWDNSDEEEQENKEKQEKEEEHEKQEEEGKDKEEEKLYDNNDKQEDGEQEEEDEEDNWKEKVLKWLKESAKGKQEEDDSDWEGTIKFSIDDYVILQNCCKRDSISTCSTCMAITILSIPCIDNSNCDINEEEEKEGDVEQNKDEVEMNA